MRASTAREDLRESYHPGEIYLLFVGEAPADDGTFFYTGDTDLVTCTQQAFEAAFKTEFATPRDFLRFFRAAGCFYDDLWLSSIDQYPEARRRHYRAKGVDPLAERLRTYQPYAVISVKRAIAPHVRWALQKAELPETELFAVPLPAGGCEGQVVEQLTDILFDLLSRGKLRIKAA